MSKIDIDAQLFTNRRRRRAACRDEIETQVALVSMTLIAARADRDAAVARLEREIDLVNIMPITHRITWLTQLEMRCRRELERRNKHRR
jgi:hypothetical protein